MDKAALKGRARRIFAGAGSADSIIIVNSNYQDPNFLYLTDISSGLFEGSLIVLKKNGAKLLTSPLEYEDAVKAGLGGIQVIKIDSAEKAKGILSKELKGRRIGMNEEFVSYSTRMRFVRKYRPSKVMDVSKAFADARLVKDAHEIRQIRKAAGITKRAMKEIRGFFKEGITEKELADRFNDISSKLGSKEPSFETIVCFGANASMPHHSPGVTRLRSGDFILIDAGSKVGNYCSDITRTFIFGSKKAGIKDYQRKLEIYNLVKLAQGRAIASIKPGVKASRIHKIAEDCINGYKGGIYKGTFIHSLGHSLGIEVHDGAGLSPGANYALKENMVVTVEPGIYISKFGGVRIEDDILVTKKGAVIL